VTSYAADLEFIDGGVEDWRQGAPCGTVDPNLFFEQAEDDDDSTEMAKTICRGCPVSERCLDESMLLREEYGIWGGMTPGERTAYRRTWLRLKGGKSAVKGMREGQGILIHDPSIDRRYQARLRAARRCLELLLQEHTIQRRQDYIQVLDLIVANPSQGSEVLARRLGRSPTWFNTMKRDIYAHFGIEENYYEDEERTA
jgi:WhiB family redox-sensing transcriptional regulator